MARSVGGRRRRAGSCSGRPALTAWDLFLDPQMTAEGYWRWTRRGRYRGIPLTNYAGWLLTSVAVMAALEALLPPDEPDRALVGEYAAMGVMETVGLRRVLPGPPRRRRRWGGDAAARRRRGRRRGAVDRWVTVGRPSSSAPGSAGWPRRSVWPPPATGSSCSSATRRPAASSPSVVTTGARSTSGPRCSRCPTSSTSCFRTRRHHAGRRGRPRPARPAVPLPLADGASLVVPDDAHGDRRRVRGVPARCRSGLAPVRRARAPDLGGQRAHVLRRADGWARAAAPADALAARPR